MMQPATISVPAGGDLQSAFNSAQPGDTVQGADGAVFTCNCVINKGITVQGKFTVKTPNSDPAIYIPPKTAPVVIQGVEITTTGRTYDIVRWGSEGAEQDTLAEVPQGLTLDGVYIHGQPGQDVRRGVAANGANFVLKNFKISEIHERGADSQGVSAWNGSGPFAITNGSIEAAGENVMFGGADASIPNLIPSGITVQDVSFTKRPEWNPNDPAYAGIPWSAKNGFELKNAAFVVLNRNTFDNIFCASQQHTIVLTPRNQNNTNPWAVVKNVAILNTIIRNSCAAININAEDDIYPSIQLSDVKIDNLLTYNLASGHPAFTINSQKVGAKNVSFNHITAQNVSTMVETDGIAASTGFSWANSIMRLGPSSIGFHCSGDGTGKACLDPKFPGYVWNKMVLIGTQEAIYPPGTTFVANDAAVGFVNPSAGNFALSASSPYRGAATDGTDIGVNMALLPGAVVPQPTPTVTPTPIVTPTPTATPTPPPAQTGDWPWPSSQSDRRKLRETLRQAGWRSCFVTGSSYYCEKP